MCGDCNKNDVVSNLHRSRAPSHSKRKAVTSAGSSSSSSSNNEKPAKQPTRKRKAEQSASADLTTGEMTPKKKRALRNVHDMLAKGVSVTDPHLFAALQEFVAD